MLFREVAVSLATVMLGAMGARRIDVTWTGKTATFGLMIALPFCCWEIRAWAGSSLARRRLGLGIPSLALSYYAAVEYIPRARHALAEGRAAASS